MAAAADVSRLAAAISRLSGRCCGPSRRSLLSARSASRSSGAHPPHRLVCTTCESLSTPGGSAQEGWAPRSMSMTASASVSIQRPVSSTCGSLARSQVYCLATASESAGAAWLTLRGLIGCGLDVSGSGFELRCHEPNVFQPRGATRSLTLVRRYLCLQRQNAISTSTTAPKMPTGTSMVTGEVAAALSLADSWAEKGWSTLPVAENTSCERSQAPLLSIIAPSTGWIWTSSEPVTPDESSTPTDICVMPTASLSRLRRASPELCTMYVRVTVATPPTVKISTSAFVTGLPSVRKTGSEKPISSTKAARQMPSEGHAIAPKAHA